MASLKVNIGSKTEIHTLPIGGSDKHGNVYGSNNKYLTINERAVLPIMGEFHFSRYPENEWEEEILKMKEGKVSILATYLFWIHHEEIEGEFDFTGCRNVRKFLELCKKNDMSVFLRIGPWAHGECRNGGFPDWLVNKMGHNGLYPLKKREDDYIMPRTNNPVYLDYVQKYWTRISEETKGMLAKDGGPVIGIQLENEYCHAGGPSDVREGIAHMIKLKELAISLGFDVPWYTATGWGGGIVIDNETLPVFGGYVDAPWAGDTKELPASENFLFQPFHNDANIGSDLASGTITESFDREKNPYLTAELGGGLQVTALRRTYPYTTDTLAQAFCMLGSGANLLGYYMYHGGVNPDGKLTTLQESKETGYFNDLPIKSYDFQAPIRESGIKNVSFYALADLHSFINEYEEVLARSEVYLPDIKPQTPEDMVTPRVSVRYDHDSKTAFVFINAHQRNRKMKAVEDLDLTLIFENGETKTFKKMSCDSDDCCVYVISDKINKKYTFNTTGYQTIADEAFAREYSKEQNVRFEIVTSSKDCTNNGTNDINSHNNTNNCTNDTNRGDDYKLYRINVDDIGDDFAKSERLFINIDYDGDKAELYGDDKLLTDWFSNGENWTVALSRYSMYNEFRLKIYPFKEDVYYDLPPKKGCNLNSVTKFIHKED